MLHLLTSLQVLATTTAARWRARATDDRGQSTAEYALVLLGAAAIALLVVAWATETDKVTDLFDSVVDRVLDQVS
jgi:hypothetical protein